MNRLKPPKWIIYIVIPTLILLTVVIYSCKKDQHLTEPIFKPDNATEKMQQWLISQKADSLASYAAKNLLNNADWKTAYTVSADSGKVYEIVAIPTVVTFNDPNKIEQRYLVLMEQNGAIIANIFDLFGTKDNIFTYRDEAITNFGNKNIGKFTGEITLSTWNNSFRRSKVYDNGNNTRFTRLETRPQSFKEKLQSVKNPQSTLKTPNGCQDWYLVTYSFDTGEIVDIQYLYTTCTAEACQSIGSRSKFGVLSVRLSCDGGTPGNPTNQPPTPTQSVPCSGKDSVNKQNLNPVINYLNNLIWSKRLADNSVEYGANLKLADWTNSTSYINTPITSGTLGTWQPGFTWDASGYTIGFTHDHPQNNGPNPDDTFIIFEPLFNTNLRNAGDDAKDFYKSHVTVTSITAVGTYVVNIVDWGIMTDIYNNRWNGKESSFDAQWNNFALDFLNNNQQASVADAGAYAMLKLFGNSINVFYAEQGFSTFHPLSIGGQTEFDTLEYYNCP